MEQDVGTGWMEGMHPGYVQGCFDGFLPAFTFDARMSEIHDGSSAKPTRC